MPKNKKFIVGGGCLTIILIIGIIAGLLFYKFKDFMNPVNLITESKPLESSELPEQLYYLKPALEVLNNIPQEELGDANDEASDAIDKVMIKRIYGMTKSQAKQTIESDLSLIASWLKHPDMNESPAYYIEGYYFSTLMYDGIGLLMKKNK